MNTDSGRGGQSGEPISADEEQWRKLKARMTRQPNWRLVSDDGNFMQWVVTTPTMRFRDDVQLLFLPESGMIQVRSSSRLGISDMGTNARRVETLRAVLKE